MALVSVSDSPARGGGWISERKGPVLELTNRRYKRTLIVESDDPDDGPETVLGFDGVPTIGSTYALGNDEDDIATCIDLQCEPLRDYPLLWKLTASYDSARVVDIALSDPLNLPPEVTWSFAKYEFPLQRDALGVPTVNSSGERYDPPLTVELSRPVLSISRNEANYSEENALAYIDAVNSDSFLIAQPWQAKLNTISGQLMCDIGIAYWKVTYEIEFQQRTFAYFILDQGFRDINGKLFRDPVDNTPAANPTLLNGRGFRQIDTYCQLANALAHTDLLISVANPTGYTGTGAPGGYFPPGPSPGSADWYFEIKIDAEIMQVTAGFGANSWIVTRGYAGSTAAGHSKGAKVYLQPYFRRFMPYKQQPFAALNLPTDLGSNITPLEGGG